MAGHLGVGRVRQHRLHVAERERPEQHARADQLLGPAGLCWQPGPHAVAGGRLARSYLYYRAATLFAGTSEIQRNILAERVLELPRGR